MPNSGALSSENDDVSSSFTDQTLYNAGEGYYLRFDQRAYTTKEDFWRANLDINGFLYIPKKCADGTVASCKLNVIFYGCGKIYRNWYDVLTEGSDSLRVNENIKYDMGWGQAAYANDQIILVPQRRDGCYDMGGKGRWENGFNNDPDVYNKNGK